MTKEEIFNLLEKDYLSEIKDFTIIQIGANDGIQDDLIRPIITKYNPKSYLVEPIKEHFDALVLNYSEFSNISFFNFAISDTDGIKEMTTLKYNDSLPIWCKGLSTFDTSFNFFGGFGGLGLKEDMRNTPLYHQVKSLEVKVNVQTKTLSNFLNENYITSIDIFVTDTEGHDYIIFEQLDLEKYSPKFIII